MREKLQKLMHDQGLTSSKLAEILEIQPSGISHLMAGRNKPGFDLLQRILRRFPQINPDWLLLDSDQMYREQFTNHEPMQMEETASSVDPTQSAGLPNIKPAPDLFAQNQNPKTQAQQNAPKIAAPENTLTTNTNNSLNLPTSRTNKIERVVIFYDDHTFESFEAKCDSKQ